MVPTQLIPGTPSTQALGNQLHSSLCTGASNSHTPAASLGSSLQFVPLLVGSGWFVLHSPLLMCRTLRLETFLLYKLCLGACRTNNHKLFGSLLHLWLHFLCSQRAERILCKIQLCCICVQEREAAQLSWCLMQSHKELRICPVAIKEENTVVKTLASFSWIYPQKPSIELICFSIFLW